MPLPPDDRKIDNHEGTKFLRETSCPSWSLLFFRPPSCSAAMKSKTKRPPGNWAASSSRENSSNGGLKFRQNFLPKSYEPKNGGVKRFLGNKRYCFQQLTKSVNIDRKCSKLRQIAPLEVVSQYF